jgi:RNA polymerase sigma factor (sigma-70 family)
VRTVAIPPPMAFGPWRSKRLLALASEDALIEQIRRGNEVAFSVAFERHAAGLLGFCRHMVGSPEEAEDAVQHTFAAAFRDLARAGEREVALTPWLYAIARNRCVSMLRSRHEHAVLDFDIPTEGLAEQVQRRADLRDLLRDLRDLPEEQRAALLLSEAGALSHAEVADVLGCDVANVKSLVFRARSGLIQRREAHETSCADIRKQLANLRGSSLRRKGLRHHLRSCAGCRRFSAQVKHQRQMLRAALPVVPSLELKSGLLAAAGLGGGSASGGVVAAVGAGLSASLSTGTLVQVAAVGGYSPRARQPGPLWSTTGTDCLLRHQGPPRMRRIPPGQGSVRRPAPSGQSRPAFERASLASSIAARCLTSRSSARERRRPLQVAPTATG